MNKVWAVLFLCWLLGVGFGVGSVILRITKIKVRRFEWMILSVSVGMGGVVILSFGLAVFGGLYRSVIMAILGILSLPLFYEIRRYRGELCWDFRRVLKKLDKGDRLGISIIFLVAVFYFFEAIAPPTMADTMAYHFAWPKLFSLEHESFYIPSSTGNTAISMHMAYAMAMSLCCDRLAALLGVSFSFLLVFTMVGFCRRFFGSWRVGLWAGIFVYTTPLMSDVAGAGGVDEGLALFTFIGFWGLCEYVRGDRNWLVIAGFGAGLAAGSKYYGLISIFAFTIIVIFHGVAKRKNGFCIARDLALFCGIAFLFSCPSYLRNLVNTGNPLYPGFFEFFGGRDWSAELNSAMKDYVSDSKRPLSVSVWTLIQLPWNLTVHGGLFNAGRNGYGPLFLCIAPVLVFAFFRSREFRQYSLIALPYILIFLIMWLAIAFHRGRHLLPLMPIIAIALSEGVRGVVSSRARCFSLVVIATATFSICFCLCVVILRGFQFVPVGIGVQSEESYKMDQLWHYKDIVWMNANLPADSKVFHTNRLLNYYLEKKYFFASIFFQGYVDWASIRSAEELMQRLREIGITHIFMDEPISPRLLVKGESFVDRSKRFTAELVQSYGQEIYRDHRQMPLTRTFNLGIRKVYSTLYKLDFPGER